MNACKISSAPPLKQYFSIAFPELAASQYTPSKDSVSEQFKHYLKVIESQRKEHPIATKDKDIKYQQILTLDIRGIQDKEAWELLEAELCVWSKLDKTIKKRTTIKIYDQKRFLQFERLFKAYNFIALPAENGYILQFNHLKKTGFLFGQ